MKIPARIAVPIALAVGLSALIGLFFLWQIHSSVSVIESSFKMKKVGDFTDALLSRNGRTTEIVGNQSEALILLRQGEIFELKGEWKHAEEKYVESISNGGGTPAIRKLASIQLQRREYDAAKETIQKLKDSGSNGDDVMLLEGLLALRKGDISTAKSIFNRRADTPQSEYGLGIAAIAEGKHEEARTNLTKASAGTDAVIRSFASTVLSAYEEFALFPDGQTIHLQTLLARALAQVNECETALPMLNNVIASQGRYRDAWIVKGYCEFATERTEQSLASLEQAYSLDPEKPEIQYFLARTHAALGDPQNAVTFLQYALINGFEPERDARELLSDYAKELGNLDLALEQLKILTEDEDADFATFERYVELAIATPDRSLDALAMAKTALTKWPDDSKTLTLAARAAYSAGSLTDAETYIDKALKIDPKNTEAMEVQDSMKKNAQ